MIVQIILNLKSRLIIVLIACVLVTTSCASNKSKTTYQGYQPKYKKPKPNKPLPCPMKDC